LLPVDHLPLLDMRRRRLLLVEHHGPKKVNGSVLPTLHLLRELSSDVLPERVVVQV